MCSVVGTRIACCTECVLVLVVFGVGVVGVSCACCWDKVIGRILLARFFANGTFSYAGAYALCLWLKKIEENIN